MNELDHLRRMRGGVPEYGPEELAMRTGWRPDGKRVRSRPRPVSLLPLALSGSAVLAAAAVFAFLVLGPIDLTEPDTVVAGPGPAASEEPESADDTMEVMGPVIEAARTQEVDGGAWYVHMVHGQGRGAGPEDGRYGVYGLRTSETWTDMAAGVIMAYTESADWSLMGEEDRAAWKRDGSPTYWPSGSEPGSWEVPPSLDPSTPLDSDSPVEYDFGSRSLTVEELQELPSSPDELADLLLDGSGETGEPEQATLPVRAALHQPLPPEVRAGVYTVLARMPELRAVTDVTDVSGRPAVGVAYEFTGGDSGRYERRILFDPETGMLLSMELVVVEPAASKADWGESGDVIDYWLYESMGWTDEGP